MRRYFDLGSPAAGSVSPLVEAGDLDWIHDGLGRSVEGSGSCDCSFLHPYVIDQTCEACLGFPHGLHIVVRSVKGLGRPLKGDQSCLRVDDAFLVL